LWLPKILKKGVFAWKKLSGKRKTYFGINCYKVGKRRINMKKRLIFLFLMLASVLIVTACASSPPATTPAVPANNPPAAQNPAVSIESFSFKPAVLAVSAGTTVIWTNNDAAGHDIKATDFSSKVLAKGETFAFKFEKTGTYDYSCGIHPTMTGKIIVE
jgi:plastocyanin